MGQGHHGSGLEAQRFLFFHVFFFFQLLCVVKGKKKKKIEELGKSILFTLLQRDESSIEIRVCHGVVSS